MNQAASTSAAPVPTLYNQIVGQHPDAPDAPSWPSAESSMYRARQRALPVNPPDLVGLNLAGKMQIVQISKLKSFVGTPYERCRDNTPFTLFDRISTNGRRVLALCHPTDFQSLCLSTTAMSDGKFSHLPAQIGQLYSLHGYVDGKRIMFIFNKPKKSLQAKCCHCCSF